MIYFPEYLVRLEKFDILLFINNELTNQVHKLKIFVSRTFRKLNAFLLHG